MKRVFLASLLVTAGLSLMAQKVEKAKELLERKKLPDAKTQIDKALENAKKANDPAALYTKAKIYVAIADDSVLKSTVPDAREQAFEALKKYALVDTKLFLLQLDQYRSAFDIYNGYYRIGAAFYNSNNFKGAFINFKKCIEVGDYVRENRWKDAPAPLYTSVIDTNVVLFTGIAAERTGSKDTAAIYYGLLADKKIKITGMLEVCKWLTDYYYQKQDIVNAKKYINLGKELYPNDNYWASIEFEIASSSGDRTTLYKKYDEMIAKDSTNYIYPFNYGVELYKEAYAEDVDKRPANSKEMIVKAEAMIRKSLELNPDYIQANLVLGQMLYNKAVELSTQQRMIKPGIPVSKLTPEEIKMKEDLKTEMTNKFDEAIPYLEKVGNALGSQGKLKGEDRRALKDAYDLLTTIYDNKMDKAKMEEYQDKFNKVDKVH